MTVWLALTIAAALVGFLLGGYSRGRATPTSDVCDLIDHRTGRHQNAKVISLGAAVGTFVLLLIIVITGRDISWPLAAVIGAFFFGPLSVDVIKALAKIRHAAKGTP